jgi:hypothetical protein
MEIVQNLFINNSYVLHTNIMQIENTFETRIDSITIIPIFFTRNFGQKKPILDKHKKNLLVILNKLF